MRTPVNKFNQPPLVVGTLLGTQSIRLQLARARRANIDLLECRLDTFPFILGDHSTAVNLSKKLIREIKSVTHKKVLLTLRSYREQGPVKNTALAIGETRRLRLLEELLPACDLVDIELRASKIIKHVISAARRHKVKTIGSYHDFVHVPTTRTFPKLFQQAERMNIDFLKLAITPHTAEELDHFLSWGQALKRQGKILIAMGPLGQPTRVLAGCFGSKMTYGHLGTSAAPGQMSVRDLNKALANVYGR